MLVFVQGVGTVTTLFPRSGFSRASFLFAVLPSLPSVCTLAVLTTQPDPLHGAQE